ncbi:MAG: LamG-like jellyroll fold domain-containing protein, partial [Planctomycetota bacterium]
MCRKLIFLTSFLLVLGLVSHASADLVAHWKFDDGSGITAKDSSRNGHDGTLKGDPQWVAGQLGGALDFDGAGDFVEVPHSPSLSITNEITIAAWTKMRGNASGEMAIVSKGGWSANDLPYELTETPGGVIYWQFYDDGGRDSCAPLSPPVDEWHHIAATYDGTIFKCYIDGQLADEWRYVGKMPKNTASVTIGRRSRGGTFFNGMIDEVVIFNRALGAEEIPNIMIGVGGFGLASEPNPADGATDVPRDIVLSWTPGEFADKHDVYLGTVFYDVNDASRTNPLGVLAGQNQDPNIYAPPERLAFSETYYWRVDEVNGPPDYTVYEGDLWSFTTEPIGYPIENITATASSAHQADMGPENSINGSGLDANDLHSNEPTDMWLSSAELLGAWIEYQFDKVYKLHQMWVWNSNQMVESLVGMGFRDVTIEYSTNGTDYTTLGTTHEFAQAPGAAGYAHNTTVDFGGAGAKYVRLTATSNWGGIMPQYGLSEVRFLHIPVSATKPYPGSGATGVEPDVVLGWRAGREAVTHDVYFSTDEQAVIDRTAPVATVTEARHGPLSLDLDVTHYWRVDEVNEAETPTTWESNIWSFRVSDH